MIMVNSGHIAICRSMMNETFHLAWGNLPDNYFNPWGINNSPPVEDPNTNSLLQELGRRVAHAKSYAIEDVNGEIVANGTKWSLSNTPTRFIYLQFKFDDEDAAESIIYQLGIFIGTVKNPDVPEGKLYLLPSEIQDSGTLFMLENIVPIARNPSTRQIFEHVITF